MSTVHPTISDLENSVWCLIDSLKWDDKAYICSDCRDRISTSQFMVIDQLCEHIEREKYDRLPDGGHPF